MKIQTVCAECAIHMVSLVENLGISCCISFWTARTGISKLICQLKKKNHPTTQPTNRFLVERNFQNCWGKCLLHLRICLCGARAFTRMLLKPAFKKDNLSFFSSEKNDKLIWNACRFQKQIDLSPRVLPVPDYELSLLWTLLFLVRFRGEMSIYTTRIYMSKMLVDMYKIQTDWKLNQEMRFYATGLK